MHRLIFAAALALCATAAQAAEPQQFDIVCQTRTTVQNVDAGGNAKTSGERMVEVRYSLDLTGNRWCADDNCRAGRVTAFSSIGDDVIIIDSLDTDQRRGGVRYTRSTGMFEFFFSPKPGYAGVYLRASGPCRVEPFTEPAPPQG